MKLKLGPLILPLSLTLAATLNAAEYNWTNGSNAWNLGTNWTTLPADDANFPNAIGDIANVNFDIGAATTINLNAGTTVGTLNLSDADFAYTIAAGGGSLTMNQDSAGAGTATITTAGVAHTISSNIALGDALTFNLASGLTASGVISGSNNIVKTGAGALTLSGSANTFVGSTTINAGMVDVRKNSAFGGTGNAVALGTGSAGSDNVTLLIGATGGLTIGQNITVNNGNSSGTTTIGMANVGGGNNANYTGLITLNRDINLTGSTNGTLNVNTTGGQRITGTGGIATGGSNSIIALGGANDFTGNFTLNNTRLRIGTDSVGTVGSITSSAIGRGTLIINGGTDATISSNGTTARTILNPVTLTGGNIRIGDGTNNGLMTFEGAVTLTGTTQITTQSSAVINGVIDDGAGTFGITKGQGGNTLTLNNANLYNGVTTLAGGGGTVAIGNNAAFGTGNIAYSLFAGTLTQNLRSTDTTARTVSNTFSTVGGNSGVAMTFGFGSTVAGENGNLTFSSGLNMGTQGSGTNGRTFNVHNTTTFNGNVTEGGGTFNVAKQGTGTLILAGGANNWSGSTTVSAGTLLINGTLVASGSDAVTVNSGATLGGTGTINRAVNVSTGGNIAPGSDSDGLTLGNGLTLAGLFQWDLNALSTSNAGTDFDVLTITVGNADITGAALGLNLGANAPSAVPFWQSDQTWLGILNNTGLGTLTGTFAAIDNSAWSTLGSFTTTYTGNDVNLVWTAVPEPSGAALVGGLGVLALFRRQRSSRR